MNMKLRKIPFSPPDMTKMANLEWLYYNWF